LVIKTQGPPPLDLVEDLLNTDDRFHGVDLLTHAKGISRVASHLGVRNDFGDGAELAQLRDALRTLVVGEPDRPTLGAIAARHPLHVVFEASRPRLDGATGIAKVLAMVHEVMTNGSWARVRSCRNPNCGWIYYDSSKNGSGRWCSTECSHVMRSRAYRARRAE